MFVAAILGNVFEACRAMQILIGDMDREQYFTSLITRREIEKQLRILIDNAKLVPDEVKQQMSRVPWDDWINLESQLGCSTLDMQDAVWHVLSERLPVTVHYMWMYWQKLPALFKFTPPTPP